MSCDTVDTNKYLTDSALAVEYGVSTRTIQRMAGQPGFPAPIRIGRCCRWSKAEVEAHFRKGESAAQQQREAE